ncbi:hypothetical protein GTA62_21010 [Roseobacter sp. HKCCD9010]|uniref:hypothetical protein n=1 Tax=unclassified Roseobacter TaxID=196798 RepID=UPI001492335A|nr:MULTISPECIES: hypothetical protein [unclassified Roseobacter]MBF9052468.1 hypothetical protein [Rhodobacterales bacterium HKCCD4356]NNV14225.1 hypothetical protein [Roseobacter sp. HKCCD7357]NNV18660.1 hypothetical protein [Roseobacter sp. HKCCD8768]NNV28112.1 hypothetical protein [Roseobacter sp. HKCCD8192]NNV32394.1 hypothetical protein [Roseobacter sp. HKCCD9061]
MREIFATMLAVDALSWHYKSGLHPTLREAMAAELRFPSKSAGPTAQTRCESASEVWQLRAVTEIADRKRA